MPRVDITLVGRSYPISCEPGSEARLQQLADYVDQKMRQMAQSGAAQMSETRLMLLTALMLADEVLDLKARKTPAAPSGLAAADETLLVAAVEDLAARLAQITSKLT